MAEPMSDQEYIARLEAEVERLEARVTELEGDPRMAFTGQHYCDLRNFISDARARWEPHLGAEYMDDLDELVRQALIAHRAALAAEGAKETT